MADQPFDSFLYIGYRFGYMDWRKLYLPFFVFILMAGFGVYKYFITSEDEEGRKAFTDVKGEVLVGVERDYRPFAYMEDGRLVGFDVDITLAVCKEMRVQCRIVPMDFPLLIPALNRGEINMIVAGLSRNPEREKTMAFSDPYYNTLLHFIAYNPNIGTVRLNDVNFRANTLFGVQENSNQYAYIKKKMHDYPQNIKTFSGYTDMAAALLDREVDVIIIDGFAALDFLSSNSEIYSAGTLEHGDADMGDMDTLRIAVSKKDRRDIEAINNALTNLRWRGEYQSIARAYFPFINE